MSELQSRVAAALSTRRPELLKGVAEDIAAGNVMTPADQRAVMKLCADLIEDRGVLGEKLTALERRSREFEQHAQGLLVKVREFNETLADALRER